MKKQRLYPLLLICFLAFSLALVSCEFNIYDGFHVDVGGVDVGIDVGGIDVGGNNSGTPSSDVGVPDELNSSPAANTHSPPAGPVTNPPSSPVRPGTNSPSPPARPGKGGPGV